MVNATTIDRLLSIAVYYEAQGLWAIAHSVLNGAIHLEITGSLAILEDELISCIIGLSRCNFADIAKLLTMTYWTVRRLVDVSKQVWVEMLSQLAGQRK